MNRFRLQSMLSIVIRSAAVIALVLAFVGAPLIHAHYVPIDTSHHMSVLADSGDDGPSPFAPAAYGDWHCNAGMVCFAALAVSVVDLESPKRLRAPWAIPRQNVSQSPVYGLLRPPRYA